MININYMKEFKVDVVGLYPCISYRFQKKAFMRKWIRDFSPESIEYHTQYTGYHFGAYSKETLEFINTIKPKMPPFHALYYFPNS